MSRNLFKTLFNFELHSKFPRTGCILLRVFSNFCKNYLKFRITSTTFSNFQVLKTQTAMKIINIKNLPENSSTDKMSRHFWYLGFNFVNILRHKFLFFPIVLPLILFTNNNTISNEFFKNIIFILKVCLSSRGHLFKIGAPPPTPSFGSQYFHLVNKNRLAALLLADKEDEFLFAYHHPPSLDLPQWIS